LHLGFWDFLILFVFFGSMAGLGLWLSRREKDTEDYFVAGRRLPGWAVGLSILGTCISSVTYVAYPGKSFIDDWQYLVQGLMLPLLVLCGGFLVVPFYRKHVKVSVNEFVEMRFGPKVRAFTLFVLAASELARLSMVLYLVSLVINTITGYPIVLVILVIGAVTVTYTVAGGIEGTIWTDVIQTLLLFAGGLTVVILVSMRIPGGFGGALSYAAEAGKLKMFDFEPTFTRPAFYVLALSGVLNFFYFLAGNQNQVQRYQCVDTEAGARRAILIGSLGSVPVWALFMLVGTMLWVYYGHYADPQVTAFAAAKEGDKVFPHFIATKLPEGVSGILLAGLFAAAMSTIDSSMNVLSTLIITDLYRRFIRPAAAEARAFFLARIMTLVWGAAGVTNFYFEIVAIIGGGIGGIFALALLTRRAHSRGVLAGIVLGVLVTVWGSEKYSGFMTARLPALEFPWDPIMVGVLTSVVVWAGGWLASIIIPPADKTDKKPPVLWDAVKARGGGGE